MLKFYFAKKTEKHPSQRTTGQTGKKIHENVQKVPISGQNKLLAIYQSLKKICFSLCFDAHNFLKNGKQISVNGHGLRGHKKKSWKISQKAAINGQLNC